MSNKRQGRKGAVVPWFERGLLTGNSACPACMSPTTKAIVGERGATMGRSWDCTNPNCVNSKAQRDRNAAREQYDDLWGF